MSRLQVSEDQQHLILRGEDADRAEGAFPRAVRSGKKLLIPWSLENSIRLTAMDLPAVSPIVRDYDFGAYRISDMPHQVRMADFLVRNRRGYIFGETGTGKTLGSLWGLDYLIRLGEVKRVLVLCPLSIVNETWGDTLKTHFPHLSYSVIVGTKGKRQRLLKSKHHFHILNFDGVFSLQEDLAANDYDFVLIDESTAVKTVTTRRWKSINKVVPATARLILQTGTPIPQALPLDSGVLTPGGWRQMRDIQVGDLVTGADGRPTEVLGVWPQGIQAGFRVEFSDGASTICTGDHLWAVNSRGRRSRGLSRLVLRTKELAEPRPLPNSKGKPRNDSVRPPLVDASGAPRWAIPTVGPVEIPTQEVPLDPYTLGVLLGDGSLDYGVSLVSADSELVGFVQNSLPAPLGLRASGTRGRATRYRITSGRKGGSQPGPVRTGPARNPVTEAIRSLGLAGKRAWEKFIPEVYLWNDVATRLSILQGLCDTDGSSRGSSPKFTTTSPDLAAGVAFLVRSLGGYAVTTVETRTNVPIPGGVTLNPRDTYEVSFGIPECPFRLERKRKSWRPRWRMKERTIKAVTPIGSIDAQCITVAAEDGLFVTDDFVVTHNSPMDAYGQAKLVGNRKIPHTVARFRDEMMYRVTEFKWVPRSDSMEKVKKILTPALYVAKRDVLKDLPPVTYTYRHVEMSKAQKTLFEELRKRQQAEVEGTQITAVNAAVKMAKLLQVAGGAVYNDDGDVIACDAKARIAEMLDLIEQSLSKTIVFVPYRHVLEQIGLALKKHGVGYREIHGDVKRSDREEVFREFQKEGTFDVLLAIPNAMAHGVTATAASTIVWFMPTSRNEIYTQACARIDRKGQTLPMTICHLVAHPIEKQLYQAQQETIDYERKVLALYNRLLKGGLKDE